MKCVWLAAVCLVVACAPAAAPARAAPAGDVSQTALAADDALRAAYATADGRGLEAVFVDPALADLRRQAGMFAARALRREEEVESRRVVHLSTAGASAEVVLEVRARQRLLGASQPPAWASVLRQTRAHVVGRAGGWRVQVWTDLRPDEWWRGPS